MGGGGGGGGGVKVLGMGGIPGSPVPTESIPCMYKRHNIVCYFRSFVET